MAADFTAVTVAVVGVVGTLGGTLLTQQISIRQKKIELEARKAEAEIQRLAAADEREATARAARLAERTALCAELNMAAQAYGARCNDVIRSLAGANLPPPPDGRSLRDEAQAARVAYRELNGRAQLVLSERTLNLMAVITDCLGHTYSRMLESTEGNTSTAEEWITSIAVDVFRLLRRLLREELAVDEPAADLEAAFDALEAVHRAAHSTEMNEL